MHDEISATALSAADGVARIRHRVQQYKLEVDPNTLGMNGGNIRVVRKAGTLPRELANRSTVKKGPDVGDLDQNRIDELSRIHEQGGKPTPHEGVGLARYEEISDSSIRMPDPEDPQSLGVDIYDGNDPMSLKGPLVKDSLGNPVDNLDQRVDGLASSVVKDMSRNTATDIIIVDTYGLSAIQKGRLWSQVSEGLAATNDLGKKIIVLE